MKPLKLCFKPVYLLLLPALLCSCDTPSASPYHHNHYVFRPQATDHSTEDPSDHQEASNENSWVLPVLAGALILAHGLDNSTSSDPSSHSADDDYSAIQSQKVRDAEIARLDAAWAH